MAEKMHRMSRRALLAAAGLTPVMLAACAVSPEVRAQVETATACTAPNSGQKFAKVCERLWSAFLKGTGTKPVAPDVINEAVHLTSETLAANLGKFPDAGEDINTMFCAWRCGVIAAEKAGEGPVTAQNFSDAYTDTKEEMGLVWAKLGKHGGLAC